MTSPDDTLRHDLSSLEPSEWRRSTRALQGIAKSIVGDAAQSEDIVQGAWVRALERRDDRPGQGWLRRLVRHRAIDVRRQGRTRPAHVELLDTVASDQASADAIASRIETQRLLLDAVEALDTPYRVTIYLRYFEGLPVREVAARMGVPPKTVETRQARAVAVLRERLGPALRDPGTGRWAPALVAFYDPSSLLSPALAVPLAAPLAGLPAGSLAGSLAGPVAAPLVRLPVTQLIALLVGVTMKKFALATLALILLVTGWMAIDQLRATPDATTDGVVGADVGVEAAAPDVLPVPVDGGPERALVPDPVEPALAAAPATGLLQGSGALRVTVRWSDGEPAEGVGLVVLTPWRGPTGVRQHIREVTDADGVAFFAEVPPGEFLVRNDRGSGMEKDDLAVEISSGETTEAAVAIADGLEVTGVVRDSNGAPISGAGIWLTSRTGGWTAGAIVTSTDSGGRFALRDLPPGPSHLPSLGALAAGYLPSSLVDLDMVDKSVTPVPVELVVRRGGGAIEGRVTGEDGEPIEGAVVVIGDTDGTQEMRFNGTIEERWSARYATTDAAGHYRIDALVTGTRPLRARRLGLAQWGSEVTIGTGETTRKDIVLRPGGEVHGVVTDANGAPVAGARVQAFDLRISEAFLQNGQVDYDGAFAQDVALTAEDGTYRLGNLPRKQMFLYAMEPRTAERGRGMLMQYTKTELDLSEKEEARWDPVLSDGRVISGRALYRDGKPIENVFVSVTHLDPSAPDHRSMYTEDGDFKFIQLTGESYSASVQIWELPKGKAAPRLDGVIPGGNPIELVADFDAPVESVEGTVRVRFVDTGHRTGGASAVSVSLESLDQYSWRIGELEDDVWEFSLDSPGSYRAIAMLGERLIAVGEPFEFTAGANVDLGTLASGPGGALVLRLERSEERPPEDARLYVRHDSYRHGENLELGNSSTLRLESMEPGTGSITLLGKNLMRIELPYEIRAGEETVLDVAIEAGVGVPYHIELPAFQAAMAVTTRFIDIADGSVVHERTVADGRDYRNPIDFTIQLAPGDYRLEVELGDGRSENTTFHVPSLDPEEAPRPALTVK